MNEVRQAWSSLRSPARTSSIISNSNSNHGGSTTWYDVPAPVIVHCRNFSEDETASSKVNVQVEENAENEKPAKKKDKAEVKTFVEAKEIKSSAEQVLYENNVKISTDSTNHCHGKSDAADTESHDEEVLYENNVEAALNSFSKVCTAPPNEGNFEDVDSAPEVRDKKREKESLDEIPHRRRLSSTVELKATTTVKTNPDGMPVISFSFLQANDKHRSTNFSNDVHSEGVESAQVESTEDQLYDTPKNTEDSAVDRNGTNSFREVPEHRNSRELNNTEDDNVSSAVSIELYETPNSTPNKSGEVDLTEKDEDSKEVTSARILTHIDSSRLKNYSEKVKSSSKSLKSGRRSYGASDNEAYDPGIASMTGSYSDPECPEETSQSSTRSKRLTLQKRRLGKAWGKMRCWLREEKSKIGEVVSRHAKLQAVGALNSESHLEEGVKASRGKCASYDLTKARTQELGSIPRVEEFGLTSVSEESHVSEPERSRSKSPDSGKPSTNECSRRTMRSTLRKKTASSDDILGEEKRSRLACASFSLDKLCSDTENDEHVIVIGGGDGDGGGGGSVEGGGECTSREHSGKGGLIKKRMLGSIRGLMASTHLLQTHDHEEGGQGGFEDVRRYIKQGGDFCKDLAAILHERAELEATYAKGLSKLSSKLTKACAKDQGGNSTGGVNEAWRCVGEEMEAAAEAHRVWGMALSEQLAKPLRIGVAEAQGRSRKSIENSVDKASKSLQEWRAVASKSKKQSFSCARENERLQDIARLQSISQNQHNNNNKSSNHHMTEKEASKMESRRRKAEDSSRRADTEFYTVSVRAERARLEYENTVRKGAKQMELLEEERLSALKDFANVYLAHLQALAPRLQQSADRLSNPVRSCSVSQDVEILKNLIRRIDSNDTINGEQLLPDFYAEHITLAMNRERRKQALVRILHLIRQDLERERRGREGLETLHRAFIKTPAFAADESTQNVTDKLHHMRSMLMYLEAARYKVSGTLAEVEGSKRGTHPLAEHILVSRDKQGLQQSVLKIPSWAKNESFEFPDSQDELEVHLSKEHVNETRDWADRTAGDGNSENPPDEEDFSDFDDFSSQSEDNNNQDVEVVDVTAKAEGAEQCRAIYQYSANLNDELSLSPGDLITIHQKQADGWWIGECRGRTGIFPATYVQVIH